ncbi:hypothetical protein [Nocardioides caricicola]|uniref:Uncharacterized protein n=1 Tax=Nocardioides caricicola TaxID=634770 RepID=A0ABW0N317_9ACTN
MTPWSLPVVACTLLMGWPALWAAQVDGTLSADVAYQRLLVCLLAAWAGCSLVANLSRGVVEANEAAVRAAEKAIADAEAEAEAEREAARLEAEMERPADAAP